ncbi:hypothetical protein [Mycobacterium phage WXIN]|nr:hypothetical protein [Mycobacterium phage WXIN]
MTVLYSEDVDACERSDYDRYGLNLLAARVEYDHDEYGAIVPIVTTREFRSFISASASNDRNSTYNPNGIAEGDGALVYTDTEGDRWVWHVAGIARKCDDVHASDIGKPVYRITGFGGWYA